MKKQIKKLALKTDKIVNLSKSQAQQVAGGERAATYSCNNGCPPPTNSCG